MVGLIVVLISTVPEMDVSRDRIPVYQWMTYPGCQPSGYALAYQKVACVQAR